MARTKVKKHASGKQIDHPLPPPLNTPVPYSIATLPSLYGPKVIRKVRFKSGHGSVRLWSVGIRTGTRAFKCACVCVCVCFVTKSHRHVPKQNPNRWNDPRGEREKKKQAPEFVSIFPVPNPIGKIGFSRKEPHSDDTSARNGRKPGTNWNNALTWQTDN